MGVPLEGVSLSPTFPSFLYSKTNWEYCIYRFNHVNRYGLSTSNEIVHVKMKGGNKVLLKITPQITSCVHTT